MKVKITLFLITLVFLALATKSSAQEHKSALTEISKSTIVQEYLNQLKSDSTSVVNSNLGHEKGGEFSQNSALDNQDAGVFWKINGNYDTNSENHFVGTRDDEDLAFRRNNVFSGKIGIFNTSYGYNTGKGGESNINIGKRAGSNSNHTLNFYNVAIGELAGRSNLTGSVNTFVGSLAGMFNASGFGNTFIGVESGKFNTSGDSNTALGYRSLLKNTTGTGNIALSNASLESNDSGNHNIALGIWSLQKNVVGDENIAIGHSAGQRSTGSHNVFFGEAAGNGLESGDKNLFLGFYTGHFLNNGSENIFIGARSGYSTNVGSKNIFMGNSSGVNSGSNNISIGENAGGNQGSGNILLGNNTRINPGFQNNPLNDNVLNIGNVVFGYNMNRVSSLDGSINKSGMIGVNTTTPRTALEVNSEVKDVSGLRFTNLKSSYNPTALQPTNKFLTVNQDGDVVLQYMGNINTTNTLVSNGNTMSSNVNNIVSSTSIINSISNNFNSSNQLITTVNGVASNPITIPIPNFVEIDGSTTNELQTISQTGNSITLSHGGGTVTIPTYTDTDAQALSLYGNNLSISNGNTVVLPSTNVIAGANVTVTGNGSTTSPFQIAAQDDDHQSLTLVGNNLSISNGNTVVLPSFTEIDGSTTNELQTLTQSGNTITLSNNGGSFTLPVDTDAQSLSLNGNNLTISNGNTVALPTTQINAGVNVTVTGAGTATSPYVIASNDTSLYAANGTISAATTTNNNRVVNMNNRNIWFNTATSSTNGKLYIGSSTSYPTATGDYKLFVEGGILTEKVKVALRNTANWADYVFDENYQLMPLKDVEKFVKLNKHLPGIDSANELYKNGIDVAQMQSKQMEKIEELTLYIISQDKKIEEQNWLNSQQSKEIEELKLQVKALIEKIK